MKVLAGLKFTVFSPEQIRKMSSIKIMVPDAYDEDGYPIAGGLADQHLGVIDPGLRCKSCGGRMKDCPGHSGHIELVRPVVHAGFAKAIYQLLKACCRKCGRLMHPAESLSKIKKAAECPHCGEKQRPVKFIKPTSLYEEDRKLLPNEIRERLERIPDEDIDALNLKIRPEWLVLTVLIVPPVTVRPSITLETGERSEDDLTHKLVDIIRINQRLEENVEAGAPQLIIEDLWELLQYHVSTYFDNEIAGIPPARHRSGRQLRTLFQRLKGKEGRFRYNLSGKRVNFSARTVISPDPTLGINQLGVPEDIAAELTVPVAVTAWNLENLREVIRMQPEKINYVIRPDGKRKKITATNLNEVVEELSPGYVIERKLMDDDIVIFNRQPSLHRVSMMCHHVKVLPGKTFRFNVADCRPYNADFDGDEMNIHVPQNEEAQSEAEMLMKVDGQTISPRNGEPIITPDLDQITGLYILTLPEVEFDRADACWLLQSAGIENVEITKDMSGKEIFSTLLPDELDAFIHAKRCKYRKTKEECDNPNCVKIKKGRLVRGSVDARISDALVKLISKEYGTDKGRDYIDAVTRLTVQLATRYGLSLSLDDYYLPKEAKKDIIELYKEGRKKVRALISQYKTKKLKRLPGKTLKETLEEQVMEILENIRHECWQTVRKNIKSSPIRIGKTIIEHNPAILMAQAGVKNKPINVVQMSALVGQQAVRGKRMTSGYRRRILPHYRVGDLNDDARGFVRSNYKQGLTAAEYFFHAAGGRDSVVDKGVNPAKTGYMQRRLINALQDLIVGKDMSVRDSYGRVVQFTYGEDGKDPMTGDQVVYGDPVGVIAAQSLGEPGTQMSIAADEKVLVEKDGQIQPVAIGEFIDQIMQEHGWEKLNGTDVLNMDGSFGIRVPALTGHGKVEWKDVRQCSRHRCEKHMLEITTRSGRKIRATDNHSFVIRKQGQLVPISGSLLETGQRIPVLKHLPARANDLLEMESILSKQTHWFGSELQKAVAHSPISRTHHNLEYTVPVGADALRHYAGGHQSFDIEDGFVYPMQNHSTAHIPEKMPLDSEFGWLLGAYLSEGSLTRHGIEISNTDDGFLSPVRSFAQRLGVNFHEKDNLRGFAKGHDLTLHSSLLSEFLEKTCGKGSGHKKVPGFAFSAPNEFASALLSAYFDGDGNVSVQRKCIRASSKSKELIDGMAVLLNRFGIFCTKRASPTEHRLSISAKYAPLFKEKIGFKTPKKSSLLSQLCALPKARFAYDVVDKTTGFGTAISEIATSLKIPSRYVNKFTQKQEIGRQTLHKYVQLFEEKARTQKVDITAQIAALRQLLEEDIVWDEITSIRKVNPSKYVYDFAVEGLETFTTFDGIITHNTLRTFHYAGVASLAQLGFTRLVELVDGRKTPKKPVMEIHLKKSYAGNWEKAKAVAASIEQVTLDKVAKIEENFNRKAVTITLDRTQLREKEIKEPDILAKVKEACGEYEPDKDANVIHIKPKNDSLRNIRKLTNKLSEIHLMGIPGINRAILVEQEENGKKSYTLATEGSNLKEVFKVEEVDAEKTTTNDIMEIAETLGIEAARNAIVLETMKVLDAQGLKVDVRHIMLIADAMTAKGEVQSVGRHGLAGNKASVLARAAFEETSKHLVNAALTSEEDNLNGIIENIIAGQIIPCGTGKVKLTMEADYLS